MTQSKLKLKTYRCGSTRKKGEGLRIGTIRFLPRGVKKEDYAKFNYFDVWLPSVAPSRRLLKRIRLKEQKGENASECWKLFVSQYRKEMNKTESRQTVKLIAEISKKTPVAIGCFCEDETGCHRSILKKIITEMGNQ